MTCVRSFDRLYIGILYDVIDDAVAIANDSQYGLSGAAYTADRALGEHVARRV